MLPTNEPAGSVQYKDDPYSTRTIRTVQGRSKESNCRARHAHVRSGSDVRALHYRATIELKWFAATVYQILVDL